MLEGIAAAFSTYSAIPVPYRRSGGPGTGAALFAFPAVGLVIGAAEIIAFRLLRIFRPGAFLQGCVLAALPVLITGGIHMDGFMDTCDAIHSWKGREERLAIMKDPHTGAYAVMGAVLYMLITAGLWSEMTAAVLPVAAAGFMLSRALSALAAAVLPKARKEGMLKAETDGMPANAGRILRIESAAFALIMILAGLLCGFIAATANPAAEAAVAAESVSAVPIPAAGLLTGASAVLAEALVFLYYHRMSMRNFGGITGDLAGWFLQTAELAMLAAVFAVGRLTGLI